MLTRSLVLPSLCIAFSAGVGAWAQPSQIPTTVIPSDNDANPVRRPTPLRDRKPTKLDASGNVPLISRALLFGNPERTQARLSPDGKFLAFIAPVNGVLNVWVGPVDDLSKAKPLTNDDRRGIRQYSWTHTGQHLLFLQDKGGDENWRIYSADRANGQIKDHTPFENTQARIVKDSKKFLDEIIIGLNKRDPALHDLYRLNVRTGEMTELLKNEGYASFDVDDDFRVRMATKFKPDGGVTFSKALEGGKAGFEPFFDVPMADAQSVNIIDFNKDGTKAYLMDSRDRNTAALYSMDMTTGKKELIFENPDADVSGVLINPNTKIVEAVEAEYDRKKWTLFDLTTQPDLVAIRKFAGFGDIAITSRSDNDLVWTITLVNDDGPAETWLVERGDLSDAKRAPKVTKLFSNQPKLENEQLAPMYPVTITSRDNLNLISYLTLPLSADPDKDGKPSKAGPMVLYVHGGPWARDSWGMNSTHQWLANRGYAVLSVNFRSSTGLGKAFTNAGNLEWAGKAHDDLIDAVAWAIENKIADPKKIAIMGGSYGGYATLVGLTFTPDIFACGVDIVGPSNLVTLLNSIPAYWGPALDLMTKQVGDHRTEEGRKFLESRSPITFVDKIKKPLLIGQGANDPRVKQAESDQIVSAMQKKNIPVTYVLYPDEGHGFARPPNRMSFYAVAEAFLAQHLGGRAEPFGKDFTGSTIQVPSGADQVPGLTAALAAMPAPEAKKPEAAKP